jgi:hypothetical protein
MNVDSTPISELPGSIHQNQNPNPNPNQIQTQTQTLNQIQNHPQNQQYYPSQSLPPRDVPQSTVMYTHDEETKPNYIPGMNAPKYISTQDEECNRSYQARKYKKEMMTDILSYQDSIFLVILYVLLQLPFINNFIKLNFASLGMFEMDGTMNVKCHILKGCIMAAMYTSCNSFIATYQDNY